MFSFCSGVTEDLNGILLSESNHIGVYIGEGKVVEATLDQNYDRVVITNLFERG